MLARILKVKERISSDRELSEKLAKIGIYREATGIGRQEIPAHNTFHTLRHRLGPEGIFQIHQRFVLEAYKVGLLTPPIADLPKMVNGKIILMGDSTPQQLNYGARQILRTYFERFLCFGRRGTTSGTY